MRIVDVALDELRLAGATGAAAATVGKYDAVAQAGVENRFVALDGELAAGLQVLDGKAHEGLRVAEK